MNRQSIWVRSGRVLGMLALVLLTSCGGGKNRKLIQNKGSDTLVNVAQAWAEAYKKVNPKVAVAVTGGGSGTGTEFLQSHGRPGEACVQ